MANFVLVHGAWHGGWCYSRVAKILRAQGHDVYTPTLSGMGERSHLLNADINLNTHINDVINVIEWEDLDNVVLCGHSYGGIVVTGVADAIHERVGALVYLDAYIPEDGDSVMTFMSEEREARLLREAHAAGGLAIPAPDVSMYGVNAADLEWVQGKVTPHPLATFLQPIHLTGAHSKIRRTYVYAKGQTTTRPYFDKLMQDPAWTVLTTEKGGHDQMIDDPVAVSNILIDSIG